MTQNPDPSRRGVLAALLVIPALLGVLWFGAQPDGLESLAPVRATELGSSIDRSDAYLGGMVGADGMMNYRYNLDASVKVKRKYNVVRHAGAIYALDQAQQRQASAERLEQIRLASAFLASCCLRPIPHEPTVMGLFSDTTLTNSGDPLQVKLGSVGLGLVALSRAHANDVASVDLETLRRIGRFILWMQKEDGSFYSKYRPEGGKDDSWTSLYYPGEAALGLMMLDSIDPSSEWVEGAGRTLGYLARSRAGSDDVPADHWALIATAALMPAAERASAVVSEAELRDHTHQVLDVILAEFDSQRENGWLRGAFTKEGKAASSATRMEGLLAAWSYETDPAYRERMGVALDEGLLFLLSTQTTEGEHAGAVTRAPRKRSEIAGYDEEELASFNRRATEVRIDYVQHVLSALIEYEKTGRATP